MVASRTPSPSVPGKLLSWSRRPARVPRSTEPSAQSMQLPALTVHKAHGPVPVVRKAALSALTAAFVVAMAAVGLPSGSLVAEYLGATGAAAAGPITLRFSEYPRPFENDLLKELIPLFEKQNPDLKLVYEPITDPVKMTVNMAGGTAPDVVCWWSEELYAWAQKGMLMDLTPAIKSGAIPQSDLADFAPGQLRGFRIGNMQYALPQYLGTVALYYNGDAFERRGLDDPGPDLNWDGFLNLAQKLTIRNGQETTQWGFYLYHALDRVSYWVRQAGGEMYPEGDTSTCLLDQPVAINAISFWADFIHRWHVSPTYAEAKDELRKAFAAQQGAMFADGSWTLAYILPNSHFRLGITDLPKGPVRRSTIANMDGYGIYVNTKHPEAALRLLRFLVSPEANVLRAKYLSLQPARGSVARQWVELLLQKYPNARTTGTGLLTFATAGAYAEPGPIYYNPTLAKQKLEAAFDRIFQHGESASTVLREVVPALNQAMQAQKKGAAPARK